MRNEKVNSNLEASEIFHLVNGNGQVSRVVSWRSATLAVIYRRDTGRVEFLENLDLLKRDGIDFDVISQFERKQINAGAIKIDQVGILKSACATDIFVDEVILAPEDKKSFSQTIKYSIASHAILLVLLFISAWILNKYFYVLPVPKTVEVFAQIRPKAEPAPIVDVSQNKIVQDAKHYSVTPKNQKVFVKNNLKNYSGNADDTNSRVYGRPGKNLSNMGALAVLGGMRNGKVGASGMNMNSKFSGPGIGMGGSAQAGGYERGLIGRGFVATGIGHSGKMYGYGGYGTRGKGGGRPGYNEQDIGAGGSGGSVGASYKPLTDYDFSDSGLDVDQINSVIQRNMGQVTYCYEQGLQSTPGLSGRVNVKFIIGPSGRVSLAKIVDSSIASRMVEGCIVNKLKNWQFPKPVGSVSVRVNCPFSLKRLSQG